MKALRNIRAPRAPWPVPVLRTLNEFARFALILAPLLAGVLWQARAAVLHVAAGTGPGGDGTSERPMATISAAIEGASDGDLILIAAGVYPEQVFIRGKSDLKLKAVGIAALTAPEFKLYVDDCIRLTIEGLWFLGGRMGAKVRSSDVVFRGCNFSGSRQDHYAYGGGIEAFASRLVVRDCEFSDMYGGQVGGAVMADSTDLEFRDNVVERSTAWARGGGIMFQFLGIGSPGRLIVANNTFHLCTSDFSGALDVFGNVAGLEITDNLFVENGSDYANLGQCFLDYSGKGSIVGNSFIKTYPPCCGWQVIAISVNGDRQPEVDVRNNIFYEEKPSRVAVRAGQGTRVNLDYCLSNGPTYQGVLLGANNLFEDPLFRNPRSGDYSLRPGSPAIDSGDPNPELNDPDGSRSDIGWRPPAGTTASRHRGRRGETRKGGL